MNINDANLGRSGTPLRLGTAAVPLTGTAAVAIQHPLISAVGVQLLAIFGSGDVAISHPLTSEVGQETFSGPGAVAISHALLAALAVETFSGSGAEAVPHPLIDGVGAETFTGVAAIIGRMLINAVGALTFDAHGDVSISRSNISAIGYVYYFTHIEYEEEYATSADLSGSVGKVEFTADDRVEVVGRS